MQKGQGVSGTICGTPMLGTSRQGKEYCNFCIETSGGELMSCVAFGAVAKELADKATSGMSIKVTGRTTDDGTYAIGGFLIPQLAEKRQRAKNYIPKPPEPMRVDAIMDKLGAEYVSKRIREWTKTSGSIFGKSLTRGAGGVTKALSGFDAAGFEALLSELEKEATTPWD